MQTIKIKAYTINELSDEARKKAIDSMREINVDYVGWDESIIEQSQAGLASMGYNVKIFYSGFSSQGDGACFTGSVDIEKWLKNHRLCNTYRALYNECKKYTLFINISHNSHYYYSTSTTVEYNDTYEISEKAMQQVDAVINLIEIERETLGNRIYHKLQKSYFELLEDEAVKETIELNDYLFTKDGNRSVYL